MERDPTGQLRSDRTDRFDNSARSVGDTMDDRLVRIADRVTNIALYSVCALVLAFSASGYLKYMEILTCP